MSAVMMVRWVFGVILACVGLATLRTVSSCGMTTHSTIAHRAANYYYTSSYPSYQQLINDYPDDVSSGAPFPDYLYTCGTDHDAGEQAHWPPFQAAAANYIRAQPKPWTLDIERLVAFMMGVVSHYIADINWHGLAQSPSGYGFIETLGTQNYGCDGNLCNSAHDAADTGGEFVVGFATNLNWFHPEKWYIPTAHLIPIFATLNKSVTAASIEECQIIFTAGALAIKDLSQLIDIQETEASPFLVSEYINHPFGGLDDMAVWSARMWDRFAEWVENGPTHVTPHDHILHSQLSSYSRASSHFIKKLGHMIMSHPILSQRHTTWKYDIRTYMKHVISTLESGEISEDPYVNDAVTLISSLFHYHPKHSTSHMISSSITSSTVLFQSTQPVSYAGSAISSGDVDDDGNVDIIIGAYGYSTIHAPQQGIVYVMLSSGTITLQPPKDANQYTRFGAAITVLDYNQDGISDIVVSAPSQGWNWDETIEDVPDFRYHGAVYIYFGSTNFTGTKPDVTIVSQTQCENFGTTLTTGDLNSDGYMDLIIGSPYARGGQADSTALTRGDIRIFLSISKPKQQMDDVDADCTIYGPTHYGFFGTSMIVIPGTIPTLIVGAPGARTSTTSTETVGALYAYTFNDTILPKVKQQTMWSIMGTQPSSGFGHSLSFGSPLGPTHPSYLLVSESSYNTNTSILSGAVHAGQIHLIDMTPLQGDMSLSNVTIYLTLQGSDYGARFGKSVLLKDVNGDGNDDLIIGAPLRMNGFFQENQHETGAFYIFPGGSSLPTGIVTNAASHAKYSFIGSSAFGRLGTSIHVVNNSILVGEPRADGIKGEEMSGLVMKYIL